MQIIKDWISGMFNNFYIYDIIIRDESNTIQNCVRKNRVQKPDDETEDGDDFKISSNDPAFNIYWSNKSSEVRAMAEHFGPPDLMLIFTFNNKWDEVNGFIEKNYHHYTEKKKTIFEFNWHH